MLVYQAQDPEHKSLYHKKKKKGKKSCPGVQGYDSSSPTSEIKFSMLWYTIRISEPFG
jgi:hypothetical protein